MEREDRPEELHTEAYDEEPLSGRAPRWPGRAFVANASP
jgi:hypothetical protein